MATYDATCPFDFPIGPIIAKTFYHVHDMTDPAQVRRLMETRILLHRQSGWIGLPYVWNDEQTEATLAVAGAVGNVDWILE